MDEVEDLLYKTDPWNGGLRYHWGMVVQVAAAHLYQKRFQRFQRSKIVAVQRKKLTANYITDRGQVCRMASTARPAA